MWQDIRKPRAERIKAFAPWNTAVFLGHIPIDSGRAKSKTGSVKSSEEVVPVRDAPFSSGRFVKWTHNYNVTTKTQKYLDGAQTQM